MTTSVLSERTVSKPNYEKFHICTIFWGERSGDDDTTDHDNEATHREMKVHIPNNKISSIQLPYYDELNSDPIYYHSKFSLLFIKSNRIFEWNICGKHGKYLGDCIPNEPNIENKNYELILHQEMNAIWVINHGFIGFLNIKTLKWKIIDIDDKENKIMKLVPIESRINVIVNNKHFVYNYKTEKLVEIMDDHLPIYDEDINIKYLNHYKRMIIFGGSTNDIYYTDLDENSKFIKWQLSELKMPQKLDTPNFKITHNFGSFVGMNELIWIFYKGCRDGQIYVLDMINHKTWSFEGDECLLQGGKYKNVTEFRKKTLCVTFSLFDLITGPMRNYYHKKMDLLVVGFIRKYEKKYNLCGANSNVPIVIRQQIRGFCPDFF